MFSAKEIIHIQIFDYKSDMVQEMPDSLDKYPLLIPPILTNKIGWRKKYFKIIGNIPINNFISIKNASFFITTVRFLMIVVNHCQNRIQ